MLGMNMHFTKADISAMEQKAAIAAEMLTALANPSRLLILCQLAEGERSVGELVEAVALAQSAVSQHLAKMRTLRLVTTRREGKNIYYSIGSAEVMEILQTLYKLYCAKPQAGRKR